MRALHLAPSVVLPADAATQTFLIVGKRGSGKSNTGTCFAEELHATKIPFAVLDPVDVWWGLKAGKDGRSEGGLEVYVFGGEHADIPLEPTAGVLMADVLVEHRVSAVFVLRQFSNREKARFVSDFAEQLFKRNRDVLHLFCEEAHEVMPQQPYRGDEEMLGRMLKLQKLGRTSGIGLTAITQRPASLNKNATTQAEILIAHRLLGPQDRDAVEAWIKHHHVEDQKRDVLATLPELKTGEAWLWAPDFPEQTPMGLRRVKIREAETFDSRRTPKPGEHRHEPKTFTPVDLDRLKTKMAATIERAKAEDPKALQRRVAELERDLNLAQKLTPTKTVERNVLKESIVKRLDTILSKMVTEANRHGAAMSLFWGNLDDVAKALLDALRASIRTSSPHPAPHTIKSGPRLLVHERSSTGSEGIGSGPRKILAVLAQYPAGRTMKQVAVLTGYAQSGTFSNYVGSLRSRGWIEGHGTVRITAAGMAALGPYEPLPVGHALLAWWLHRLGKGERVILETLASVYPNRLSMAVLAEKTGYALSGTFSNYLGRLRTLDLIEGRGELKASDLFFEGGEP